MRPLFTIHAGEYLVAEHLEHLKRKAKAKYKKDLHVWVPSKDTGVDLLVTDKTNRKAVSLQVKMSKDYKKSKASNPFDQLVQSGGWLNLSHKKIKESTADYWVLVIVSWDRINDPQYIVVKPSVLLEKLKNIHGQLATYRVYPTIMKPDTAMDVRGMSKADRKKLVDGTFSLGARDFSPFLNNWDEIIKQL